MLLISLARLVVSLLVLSLLLLVLLEVLVVLDPAVVHVVRGVRGVHEEEALEGLEALAWGIPKMLCYTILYCTILYYAILYYTGLYYTRLDYNAIHEFPRRDSKPKKRLQENTAIIHIKDNKTHGIVLFSWSLLLGLESLLGNSWILFKRYSQGAQTRIRNDPIEHAWQKKATLSNEESQNDSQKGEDHTLGIPDRRRT